MLFARWLVGTGPVADFIERYPGRAPTPESTPVGFPAWLNWAHFFNIFFMALIVRTGLQIRSERRAPAYWTPHWDHKRKISITLWLHLCVDLAWILNGIVFIVLLFTTGQWMRIVPTSWEVLPNAVSAGLQYLTLDWPTEHAWVHYNGLQQIFYFLTVFVAAPLAIATGFRMSGWWSMRWKRASKIYPLTVARAVHFPVMIYFCVFTVVHVGLVLTTGVIANLNGMFAAQDSTGWLGPVLFVVAMVVTAGATLAARPMLLAPAARLMGRVTAR
ncbi:cytochrome b/b6 domain-containing protein [Corynebacterium frankenforstense]|uniref:cytochrome b/b6 domain-containing protein n=1 Tax=Corynebacterium frankenforstense TaxID=1230998 RepID=UPI0026EBF143|nr:cytochrome b/b6 domain-containing protein [Corynebacterium frankenforstense]